MESIFQEKSLVRFMLLVKAKKDVEAGKLPTEQILADLAKFNDELLKAGALIEITGLQPSCKGTRLHFSGGKCSVTDAMKHTPPPNPSLSIFFVPARLTV